MPSSEVPDLFHYVRTAQGTAEYVEFTPDPSMGIEKEIQFAYHKMSTVEDMDLFAAWAPMMIASGFPLFQVAVLQNPLATTRHLQALLAGHTPRHDLLLHASRHPNASMGILSKILDATEDTRGARVDAFIAGRADLTEPLIRRLLSRAVDGVYEALVRNPHIPEYLRAEAGLLK